MRSLDVRGISIAYEDAGDGPAVLLIHGHPFDHTMWRPQIDALARTHRVIAPDLRGYGRTTVVAGVTLLEEFARDLAALLDALGIETASVVGLSMGGQIAMAFVQLFPARVTALVLADTFAQLDRPEQRTGRFETADRIVREGMEEYAAELLPKMIAPASAQRDPAIAEHVSRMMRGTNPAGAAAALRGRALRQDYIPLLPSIDVPTLVVVGSEDEFTPVADAERMHAHLPDASVVVIEGCGHMPNLERADEFNERLEEFLASVAEPRTAVAAGRSPSIG